MSIKAEYIGLTQTTKEATWLKLLMTELGLLKSKNQNSTQIQTSKNKCAITVNGDNQKLIDLVNNPVLHAQTKHIDIQHYFI